MSPLVTAILIILAINVAVMIGAAYAAWRRERAQGRVNDIAARRYGRHR